MTAAGSLTVTGGGNSAGIGGVTINGKGYPRAGCEDNCAASAEQDRIKMWKPHGKL